MEPNVLYSKTFGVLIDEETPIKKKRIFNKNSQHHQSFLGCIICPWYYLHGPLCMDANMIEGTKDTKDLECFLRLNSITFNIFPYESFSFFLILFFAILLICIHQ
jgi:hypothetical protein